MRTSKSTAAPKPGSKQRQVSAPEADGPSRLVASVGPRGRWALPMGPQDWYQWDSFGMLPSTCRFEPREAKIRTHAATTITTTTRNTRACYDANSRFATHHVQTQSTARVLLLAPIPALPCNCYLHRLHIFQSRKHIAQHPCASPKKRPWQMQQAI